MCYAFDKFYEKARIAEQLRKKQRDEELRNQSKAAAPGQAAEPEKSGKQQEPVPA